MIDYRKVAEDFGAWLLSDSSKGTRRINDNGWIRGRCPRPSHDDKSKSFGYNQEGDGWQCSCGGGKGSDLRVELGFVSDQNGNEVRVETRMKQPRKRPDREPDKIHEYANNNRKLRFYNADGSKFCTWEHQEAGLWSDGMKGDPGLYLQGNIALSDLVALTESETDAEALMGLGVAAVSTAFGASAGLRSEQAKLFNGKTVAIFEHQDDAGRKFSASCSELLSGFVDECFVVRPPAPHKDIRDWIVADSVDMATLQALIDGARPKELMAVSAYDLLPQVPDHIEFILRPVIIMNCLTYLQGTPKGGKSCFELLMAMACALGRWVFGRFEFCGQPRRVGLISYEDNLRRIKRRVREYLPGFGTSEFPRNLFLFKKNPDIDLSTKAGEMKVRNLIKQNKLDVLMIDTLSYIYDGDENSKEDMQPVMAALRRIVDDLPVAIVLIHHTRKQSQGGDQAGVAERGRGSSAIAAAADVIIDWGVKVSPDVTKVEIKSKETSEKEFCVHYIDNKDGKVGWELIDVADREDVVKLRDKIMNAMKQLMVTSPDGVGFSTISSALPAVGERSLRRYLKNMAEKEMIEMFEGFGRKDAMGYKLPAV